MLAARKRLGNRVDLPCSVCPVLALRESFAEQLSAADAKFRRNLRTARKRLEQAGEVKCRAADASSLDDLLEALFRLHAGRWQGRGDTGQLATAGLRHFIANSRGVFWTESAREFDFLRCGEEFQVCAGGGGPGYAEVVDLTPLDRRNCEGVIP